jgi:hypothetical protein
MLDKLLPEHVLFIDIETVPLYENLASVPENMQKLWIKKAGQIAKADETAEGLYNRAGIYLHLLGEDISQRRGAGIPCKIILRR